MTTLRLGPWSIDQEQQVAFHDNGCAARLTRTTTRLACALASNPNKLLDYGIICAAGSGISSNYLNMQDKSRQYIKRLRKLLGDEDSYVYISAITKRGYVYVERYYEAYKTANKGQSNGLQAH